MFKYEVGQMVYYKAMAGIQNVKISSRHYSESEDGFYINYTVAVVYPSGQVNHLTLPEDGVFATEQEALESL